jgi:hypothetical protein
MEAHTQGKQCDVLAEAWSFRIRLGNEDVEGKIKQFVR